jgi:hypothetical protein
MTLPTYADTEPRARAWAVARGLLHPDGTSDKATPQGQMAKTMEEIGEAQEAMLELNHAKALAAEMLGPEFSLAAQCHTDGPRHRLALEFGDILVTLCLQAAMQGATLSECMALAGTLHFPSTWPFLAIHAKGLEVAINNYSARARAFIGKIALCVEDETRIQLSLTGPEVLAMALDKIEGRQGEVVEGVFVKA